MMPDAQLKPVPAPAKRNLRPLLLEWGGALAGLLLLFLPLLYDLVHGMWATEEQAHGPIILALSLWLVYRGWPKLRELTDGRPGTAWGWPLFALGALLYIFGRSQQIMSFAMASFILISAAILLVMRGWTALRVLWFPFFFMLFLIPLPGEIVSMLTLPMKLAVSFVTETLLYAVGYPIARTGVILQIGQYQLLVADACAGLQTLLTLEALGLLYLNVARTTVGFRNVTLALLIIPISFIANVIRVMVLVLITYYFGDAAGQGFLHGFAGMVLFISALMLIVSLDTLLMWLAKSWDARRAKGTA
ncbi:exosortase B [Duganella sacchari]|uniref:Exosortase B n=1 Tax=Duganella sacchari TaxID=551987 RepID=A0A1M7R0J0_9BURK|nr:exosortase B [Duganella sacchari]SHN38060.1 exosortase B [Duganella sacchari]